MKTDPITITVTPVGQNAYDRAAVPDDVHSFPGEYFTYRRQIEIQDCPHLLTTQNIREKKNIVYNFGKNSQFVLSNIFGRFQRGNDQNLIFTDKDLELAERAMRGDFDANCIGSEVRAAADISGGGDGNVFYRRVGTNVVELDDLTVGDEIDQALYWMKKIKSLNMEPYQFAMDGSGMGKTVYRALDKGGMAGFALVMANNAPTYKFQFADRYTELHYLIRDLLRLHMIRLPKHNKLIRDMQARRYVESAGRGVKCEPKEAHRSREKASPDYLDALVYLFHDFDQTQIDGMVEPVDSKRVTQGEDNRLTPMEEKAAEMARQGSNAFNQLDSQLPWFNEPARKGEQKLGWF